MSYLGRIQNPAALQSSVELFLECVRRGIFGNVWGLEPWARHCGRQSKNSSHLRRARKRHLSEQMQIKALMDDADVNAHWQSVLPDQYCADTAVVVPAIE